MSEISTEIIGIIYQLLPGFIVAWIIYGLTAYLKPDPFERIVQALIYTVMIKAMIIITKALALRIGNSFSIGPWNDNVELILSIIFAIIFGLFLTWCVNNDFPLKYIRRDTVQNNDKKNRQWKKFINKLNLTEKTLHPTEWYSAFSSNDRYIVLYLKDGLRLYGWPIQYPDDPNKGHFIIAEPEWLLDDGTTAPLHTVQEILVNSFEVERVDFLKMPNEVSIKKRELNKIKTKLISIQKKEEKNAN